MGLDEEQQEKCHGSLEASKFYLAVIKVLFLKRESSKIAQLLKT
jgi:hypothetical protein